MDVRAIRVSDNTILERCVYLGPSPVHKGHKCLTSSELDELSLPFETSFGSEKYTESTVGPSQINVPLPLWDDQLASISQPTQANAFREPNNQGSLNTLQSPSSPFGPSPSTCQTTLVGFPCFSNSRRSHLFQPAITL